MVMYERSPPQACFRELTIPFCGSCSHELVATSCEADNLCNVNLKPQLLLRLWLGF